MNAVVPLGEVELPLVVEVAAGLERAQPEDGLGASQRPDAWWIFTDAARVEAGDKTKERCAAAYVVCDGPRPPARVLRPGAKRAQSS